MIHSADYDRAFGDGADARLAGWSESINPYPTVPRNLRDAWWEGWREVDANYGRWARWPVMRLPAVTAED